MITDLDTLSSRDYLGADEVLLGRARDARAASGGRLGSAEPGRFAVSRERFESLVLFLEGDESGGLDHAELETRLERDGRALLRQLFQDHLELRAAREQRLPEVLDCEGVPRRWVEAGHGRPLQTVFGEVRVERLAYRARGHGNLYPADAALNLPVEKHSHGLRRLAAVESARGSFQDGLDAVERATGQRLGKRQLEGLARRAVVDMDGFYRQREHAPTDPSDLVVLSCDGKGIVMRPDALRPATAKLAAGSSPKLQTRLSKGEKRNRKRVAEVGAVYDLNPVPRTSSDILPGSEAEREHAVAAPAGKNKWLTASVTDDAAAVVTKVFDEAARRDPGHQRTWVALVDGNNHQIDLITREAAARAVPVTILVDLVHVIEYIWKAVWCFYEEGDPAAEQWVHRHAKRVLDGDADKVAAAIRRAATTAGLNTHQRDGVDKCANYLTHKAKYLDYPTALANGWPIATGVIEGACRYLIKDRLDITGARWGLQGAEAVLKLRALRANGDFDDYWTYHLAQERTRVHQSRYANAVIPPE